MDILFQQYVECDYANCVAKVKVYVHKTGLRLGFCAHHYFRIEYELVENGWEILAKDGVLVRQH